MSSADLKFTENKKGFTYNLTSYGKYFVEYAGNQLLPVMDIGAAFGVATIPALTNGAKVIAVDLDFRHLNSIMVDAPREYLPNLSLLNLRFPDFYYPNDSISGAYLSQVLPFLTGEEIEMGMKKLFDWIVPGGKVFIVSFSPYLKHCESYIPIYEQKSKEGVKWAGYIDDLKKYSVDNPIAKNLPNQINHVDVHDIERALTEAGFEIEIVEYFGDENEDLPEGLKFDGRERVGAVATKP